MSIELEDIKSGHSTSKINTNFQKIQASINDDTMKREVETGEANEMRTHLDMNSNEIVNMTTDVSNPNSALSVGDGDARYVNVTGDSMSGTLDMGGNKIISLATPTGGSDASNKSYVDAEVAVVDGRITSEVATLVAKDSQQDGRITSEVATLVAKDSQQDSRMDGIDGRFDTERVLSDEEYINASGDVMEGALSVLDSLLSASAMPKLTIVNTIDNAIKQIAGVVAPGVGSDYGFITEIVDEILDYGDLA